ncbi:MAG: FtsW/RodA/SpoVE family cell cycle protein [Patescibacteria group bacterium]
MVRHFLNPGNKKKQNSAGALFPWLLLLTFVITALGIFFVFEASVDESFVLFGHQYHFVKRQLGWLLIGMMGMVVGYIVPYLFWQKTGLIWFLLGLVLLIMVFIPGLGLELNGAHRWISVGPIFLQPIEFFKFATVAYFASWLAKKQNVGPFLLLIGIPALLVILQPDLGSLLILLWIAFGMYFLSGGEIKTFAAVGAIGILLIALAIVTSPYRMKRLTTFLNPESDPLGASFHIRQITLALGNGGWIGQGLGNSRQKYSYIPEASSDSIFAIVAEEIGFFGSTLVIGLYLLTFLVMFRIASSFYVLDKFKYLFLYGILIWISVQTLLNLASVVALVPLTGLPLPLFSYGGSSLAMILFVMGVFLRAKKEQ